MLFLKVFGCFALLISFASSALCKCPSSPQGTTKLVCFYEGARPLQDVDVCGCTHLVYTGSARGKELEDVAKALLEKRHKLKILLRTSGKEKDLADLIKSSTIHGIDLHEAHGELNRTRITKTVESMRSVIGSDAIFMLSLPAQSELLAKYYDLKSLVKAVSLFSVGTHFLGEVKNATFHPSRLSGVWDMLNTDSVVDLVLGLGAPASKLIITAPASAYRFQLTNSSLSTPGSPSEGMEVLDREQLCKEMGEGKWTLERDQDLAAPYAFKDNVWISFEDSSSLDVKGKYARIRGLAGLGLVGLDQDGGKACGGTLLQAALKGLATQARAPRGAVLSYLENEILSVPKSSRHVDHIQLSPYRISRVVDSDGVIHAIREDTRTEFECQRQGYFVHPRSCNRFYRCVKFDQLSEEFTVFEFDCPAGLAFDSRYEVCVWPGSLHEGQACPGSSEIAPVPDRRFICPEKPGYYADPANCRWFFACLDHGKAPLSAYEFRCPFGLGFDQSRLLCDWPWLVPGCGELGKYEASYHGQSSSVLTGASAYIGASADAVNIAAHQSLVSGASTSNLLGIQGGYGSKHNSAEQEYVSLDHSSLNIHPESQEYVAAAGHDNGQIYQTGSVAVLPAANIDSGSQILENYNGGASSVTQHGSLPSSHGSSGVYIGNGDSSGALSSSLFGAGNVNLGSSQSNLRLSHNNIGQAHENQGTYYANVASSQGSLGLSNSHLGSGNNQGILINGQQSYGKYSGGVSSSSFTLGNNGGGSDESGAYYHDNSGEYKHDYSGENSEKAVPYQHIQIGAVPYGHVEGDVYNYAGAYDKGSYSGEYDKGSYSGAYDKGSYLGAYDKGLYSGAYVDNDSGAYRQGHNIGSGSAYRGNSDEYKTSYQSGRGDISLGSAYVNNDYSNVVDGGYIAKGGAHTLTAGAINSGLVGKTTLVDAKLLQNNGYHNSGSGYSNQQFSSVTAAPAVHQTPSYSAGVNTGHSYSSVKSGNLNAYSLPSASPSPVVSLQQPISVSPFPQISTYRPTYVTSQPKTEISQVFGYKKPAVSYVQPLVTVSSTPKPLVYQQPSIAITTYNKPAVSVQQQQTYHGSNEYQEYKPVPSVISPSQIPLSHYQSQGYVSSTPNTVISYQQPTNIEYQKEISYASVTSAPTVSAVPTYVQQLDYIPQSTVSTFSKPSVSTYSYNQNIQPVVQDNHYVHRVEEKYVQKPLIQQYNAQQGHSGVYHHSNVQPAVSKQEFHQSVNSEQYLGNSYVQPAISSTARPVTYEQHSSIEYKTPEPYSGPEYLPPKLDIQVSSTPAMIQYSHQAINTYQSPKVVAQVSSTPSYESYSQTNYQQSLPQNTYSFKQEYVAPKVTYSQPAYVSSTQAPIEYKQQSIVHTYEPKIIAPLVSSTSAPVTYKPATFLEYVQPQKTYSYQAQDNLSSKVSFSQPAYVSSTQAPIKYQQDTVVHTYQSPKVVIPVVSTTPSYVEYKKPEAYQAPQQSYSYSSQEYNSAKSEYIPPVVVSSTPLPVRYEQTYTYDSPKIQSYENKQYYEQKPIIKVSTPAPFIYQKQETYEAPKLVESFEISSDYKYDQPSYISSTTEGQKYEQQYVNVQINQAPRIQYQSTTQKPSYRYTQAKFTSTAAPASSTPYNGPEYLPPTNDENDYSQLEIIRKPAVRYESTPVPTYQTSINLNPTEKYSFEQLSVTAKPTAAYNNQQTYKPIITSEKPVVTYRKPALTVDYTNLNQEKQVNLLGFGTVGPDAGLVSTGAYDEESYVERVTPTTQRVVKVKKIVRPSYAPETQRLVEVTPPTRKTRPKVAIVTKVNDFNPLIIRKLGAVCSCKSNVLRLRNPASQLGEDEYQVEYDYDVPVNGDDDDEWTYKSDSYTPSSAPIKSANPTVEYVPERSTAPIVIRKPKITVISSTLSPIIVPDYSNSYDEETIFNSAKSTLEPIVVREEDNYPVVSSTEAAKRRPTKLRSRVKSVTLAPTIETVLIPQSQNTVSVKTEKTYDRYGSGIECKREGLFRHPRNCNKFYSCRWDCSKNKFTLHTFSCPVQLSFDSNMGACNWPSQGPACQGDTLLPSGY